MGQGRGRKVKIKHGITKESMEEDDMDHIWISLDREYIRKGLIVRDGNNAIERNGRLDVHIASDGLIGDRSCSGGDSPSYWPFHCTPRYMLHGLIFCISEDSWCSYNAGSE